MTPLLRQTHCGVASSCRGSEPPPPACGLEMQALRDTDLAYPERRVRLLCRVPSSFRSIESSLPLRACNGFEESGTRKFLPNSHACHISAIFRYVFLWGSIGFSNKPPVMKIRPTALRGDVTPVILHFRTSTSIHCLNHVWHQESCMESSVADRIPGNLVRYSTRASSEARDSRSQSPFVLGTGCRTWGLVRLQSCFDRNSTSGGIRNGSRLRTPG